MANDLNQLLQRLGETISGKQASLDLQAIRDSGIESISEMMEKVLDGNTEKNTRLIICWILGRSDSAEATPVLLACAQDGDADIRAEAARSMGSLGKNECVPLLMDLLIHDSSTEVRKSAAYALGLIGDVVAQDLLVLKLRDLHELEAVREMAAEALGDLGDPFAVDPLIQALHDKSGAVVFWSVHALGRLGDPKAIPALEDLIKILDDGKQNGALLEAAREAIRNIDEADNK